MKLRTKLILGFGLVALVTVASAEELAALSEELRLATIYFKLDEDELGKVDDLG